MPTQIKNVIVFGDSLSDIGIKWKTGFGMVGQLIKEMYVSPTGRFSDCRNWTDYMYQEATGKSLFAHTAKQTIDNSLKHTTLTSDSYVELTKPGHVPLDEDSKSFTYANYAEGGACGDKPHEKAAVLGTFKEQIDKFKMNATALHRTPEPFDRKNPTLFIIWFGANDLFTANLPPDKMDRVALQVASIQRDRLFDLMPCSTFIFVNLSRPLTSVRYQERLNAAQEEQKSARKKKLKGEQSLVKRPTTMEKTINSLGEGVDIFNTKLKLLAEKNHDWRGKPDQVVELATWITEDSVRQLIEANVGFVGGAEDQKSNVHYTPDEYEGFKESKWAVIDQAHPTDRAYGVIWQMIRQKIHDADLKFGLLFEGASSEAQSVKAFKKLTEIKK